MKEQADRMVADFFLGMPIIIMIGVTVIVFGKRSLGFLILIALLSLLGIFGTSPTTIEANPLLFILRQASGYALPASLLFIAVIKVKSYLNG